MIDTGGSDPAQLVYQSESITASIQTTTLQAKFGEYLDERSKWGDTEGMAAIKTRITQGVFRNMILANYRERCAISGTSLRVAGREPHIQGHRTRGALNPENGIAGMYDKEARQSLISTTGIIESVFQQ